MITETAVALRPSGRLAIEPDQEFWSLEQVAALKVLGIKDATNGDLSVYWHVCQRTGLDPFMRQIHMINRRELQRYQDDRGQWQEKWVTKQTIQVGIDGFRVIRDRAAVQTGYVAEFEETIWYDADGREHAVWLTAEPPAACKVVLLKRPVTGIGPVLRFPAVLRTAAYMATTKQGQPAAQWRTQPDHMIEKCCEAFATRRAFPQDLGGVHIEEEMGGRDDVDGPPRPASRRVTVAAVTGQPEPPAPDELVDGEFVDEPCPAALATEVNAHFKRLGFTAADSAQVLSAAAILAGRGGDPAGSLAKVADLTEAQAVAVRGELERCATRDDLVALLAGLASGAQEGEPGE